MHTVNNVIKWSFAISGMTVLTLLGTIFAIWLLIEMLVVLIGITS